ncbi:hypothetical protein ASD64_20045 [Mesorhizobium sp. Root157]|nr:hypothetical protein ASD64_20045 [Mesorhizobium sp. Root157]
MFPLSFISFLSVKIVGNHLFVKSFVGALRISQIGLAGEARASRSKAETGFATMTCARPEAC